MKDPVKTLIKSPSAFMVGLLILVLGLILVIRAASGTQMGNSASPESTSGNSGVGNTIR